MKRVLFLFIAIVFLSGCGSQTYTNEDTNNSLSLYTTQTPSQSTSTVQTTKDTEATSEITSEEKNNVDSDTKEITVYITETGEKYHRDGCKYLSKSRIPISLSEAVSEGYGACSVCKPPLLETAPTVTEKSAQVEQEEVTVYITKTGSKYHRAGCRYLSKSSIPISLSDAKSRYSPCSVCNPPR